VSLVWSKLLISTIRIVDINNSNCWYQQFELLQVTIVDISNSNCWYQQLYWIVDINNLNCWYQQLWINVNSTCHNYQHWNQYLRRHSTVIRRDPQNLFQKYVSHQQTIIVLYELGAYFMWLYAQLVFKFTLSCTDDTEWILLIQFGIEAERMTAARVCPVV